MSRLTRQAWEAFRDGVRTRKLDRPLSTAIAESLRVEIDPPLDRDVVARCFGEERAARLIERIEELCAETLAIKLPDWGDNPKRVHRQVRIAVRDAHPELSEEALTKLADLYAQRSAPEDC